MQTFLKKVGDVTENNVCLPEEMWWLIEKCPTASDKTRTTAWVGRWVCKGDGKPLASAKVKQKINSKLEYINNKHLQQK